jgi:hypothetical protein
MVALTSIPSTVARCADAMMLNVIPKRVVGMTEMEGIGGFLHLASLPARSSVRSHARYPVIF